MKQVYIKYLFKDQKTAEEAVEALVEEQGGTIASFGVGEKQYEGFDFDEGTATFSPYAVNSEELCLLEWKTMTEEADDEDAWISPHCFEDYDTFLFNGANIQGEECDFGIKGE